MLLSVFISFLMLKLAHCTDDKSRETMTVSVGDDVTLECPRETSEIKANLFWFRLVSGAITENIGGTYSTDNDAVIQKSRFTVKQEPKMYILILSQTELSDTGLYFCVKQNGLELKFLKVVFLSIKGQETRITAVIQGYPIEQVHLADSRTLQCSVLRDKSSNTCPDKPRVFWFRSGSDDSRPSVIYTHGNTSDGCEESPETPSLQRCVYSFSKTVSSSDDETYYCAVVACGEILFGNGTKLTSEAWNNTALFVLSAALVICLIVIVSLIYTIKTKSFCKAVVPDQQNQQRGEDSLVYAAPKFSERKPNKERRRNGKPAEEDTIYTDVRKVEKN